MNKEMKTKQNKLPITARLGKGKVTKRGKGTNQKNARNRITGGKAAQKKGPHLKITRTIGAGRGRISVKNRNLITRGGKILRIKRNITLNSGKTLDKPLGRKLQTKKIRNITHNRLGPNLNSSVRKVEFDDQSGLEVDTHQDNFFGKVNFGFEAVPAFPQVPLLPTPQVQQRIFPPVLDPFLNSQNLMNINMDNRNLEMQNAHKYEEYQEDLMAMERKRVEEDLREMERKRKEEIKEMERKRKEEIKEMERKRMEEKMREMERKRMEEIRERERKQMEERMFEEEQRRFEEEQRQFEEEQRKIDEERRNLSELRKALEREKRDLEILKKTVEEEEIERRSVSKGREMSNEFVGGFDSNRLNQRGKGSFTQSQKYQDNHSKPNLQRMPTAQRFENVTKKNKNQNRERIDARANMSNKQFGKEDFNSPSQRMPSAGLLDFMLNKSSGGRSDLGGSERREMGGNSMDRGGGRGKSSNNTIGGQRGGGGGRNKNMDRGRGGNKSRGFNQNSKFSEPERNFNKRDSSPQSHRMPTVSGLMSYMLNSEPRGTQNYSQGSNFNQSNNYYPDNIDMSRGAGYDDMSRRDEFDMSRKDRYDDMSGRERYDDMSGRERYDDISGRERYDDMSGRERYDDMTRRGEYDMSRSGEYDKSRSGEYDMSRSGEYDKSRSVEYDMSRSGEYKSRSVEYDMSKRSEHSFSGVNNNDHSFYRGSSRNNEMISNQNPSYDIQTESGYQVLSRGFKPFKEEEQRTSNQSTNNFSSFQESFPGHPFYDGFYDQGRISRNHTENSGRLGSLEKQETWRGTSFSSRSEENKFGFVGYPFRNKSPIYEGPKGFERNYNNKDQSLVGFGSNIGNQQEKSTDSFYSYRPNDKQANNSSKSRKSGNSGIDILGGGTSFMAGSSGSSKRNLGQNSGTSYNDSFFGKVVKNPKMESTSNSNSSKNANNNEMGSESQDIKRMLKKKKKNIMQHLKKLDPSKQDRKEVLLKSLNDVNSRLSRLNNQYGQNVY